jgi:hypothetical protein
MFGAVSSNVADRDDRRAVVIGGDAPSSFGIKRARTRRGLSACDDGSTCDGDDNTMRVVTDDDGDDDGDDVGDDDDDGGGDDVGDGAMVPSSLSVEQCVSSSTHISVSSDSLVLGTDSVESDIDVGDDDAESISSQWPSWWWWWWWS